jgi:hypothetical protein
MAFSDEPQSAQLTTGQGPRSVHESSPARRDDQTLRCSQFGFVPNKRQGDCISLSMQSS